MSEMTDFIKSAGTLYPEVLENAVSVRESLRRSYENIGYHLRPEPESFGDGGVLSGPSDVLLCKSNGHAYSSVAGPYPLTVEKGTNPYVGGFTDRYSETLLLTDDSAKDEVGNPITDGRSKVDQAFLRGARAEVDGTFKTPVELGLRTGPIVYWTRGGAAGLVTDLSRYFPRGFNLGPGSAEAAGLKAYYVSQTGSDASDGLSWATALASITTAVNKPDADIVFITAGPWTISNGFTSKTLSRDLVLCCPYGEAFISNQRATTWTANGDGTFTSASLGGTPIRVADFRYVDDFGDTIWLSKKTSLSEVQATPYSWAVTGGSGSTQVVTVNLPSLVPSNDSTVVLRSAPVQVDFAAQPYRFYAKNICFFGGDSASMTPKNGVDGSVYASENCRYLSPHLNDCLRVQGVGLVISMRCLASNGAKDGFNYHMAPNTNGDTVQSHFVEIDCVSHNNKTTAGTANGSTAHESCVGFRLGCSYGYGTGPGVADINDSKTFCVSCTSNGGFGDGNAKGFLPADNCRMWLHNSSGFGNRTADFAPQDSAVLYVKGSYAGVYAKVGSASIVKF